MVSRKIHGVAQWLVPHDGIAELLLVVVKNAILLVILEIIGSVVIVDGRYNIRGEVYWFNPRQGRVFFSILALVS